MPSDASTPLYRGLIVPDPRITGLWKAENQEGSPAGAQPGIVVPGRATDMIVRASGTIDPDIDPLDIYCVRNGFPARDLGARIAIRTADQIPAEEWRGHWAAHLWHTRNAVVGTTVTTRDFGTKPTVDYFPDGEGVLAYIVEVTGGTPDFQIYTATKVADEPWGAGVLTIADLPSDTAPAIVVLPNGKVLLFAWVDNSGLGSFDMWVSEDSGVTYIRTARSVTPPLTSVLTLQRVSVDYGGPGELLLMAHFQDSGVADANVLYQFASADLGSSFQLVVAQDDSGALNPDPLDPTPQQDWLQSGALPVVIGDRAGFLVVYSEPNFSWYPSVRRLGSAYGSFRSSPALFLHPLACFDGTNNGDVAGCEDRNGTVWVQFRAVGLASPLPTIYGSMSNDSGRRWRDTPNRISTAQSVPAALPRIDMSINNWSFTRMVMAWDRGKAMLYHSLDPNQPEDFRQSLYEIQCGGWHAPQAQISGTARLPGELASQTPPTDLYYPWRSPVGLGLVQESAGVFTQSVDGLGLILGADAGQGNYVAFRGTQEDTGVDGSQSFFFDGFPQLGAIGFSCGAHVSGNTYVAYVSIDQANGLQVWDSSGDVLIGSSGWAGRQQVCLGVRTSTRAGENPIVSCWTRGVQNGVHSSTWTLVVDKVVLGISADDHEPLFGILNKPAFAGQVFDSVIYAAGWWDTGQTGGPRDGSGAWHQGRLGTIEVPGEMPGRALAVVPVYSLQNLYLSGFAGPAFVGDNWLHTPFFDFGIDQAVPQINRSPNQGFKSRGSGGSAAWAVDLQGTETETLIETSVLAIHVAKTNWANWVVEGYDEDTNSWVIIETIDTRLAFGKLSWEKIDRTYILTGITLKPTDLTTEGYYIKDGEFDGSSLHFLDGDDDDVVQTEVNILHNTGGLVSTAFSQDETRSPRFYLDGENFLPTINTCMIVPRNFTVLIRQDTNASRYRGIRVRMIGDPLTVENSSTVSEAGAVVIGSAWLFGMTWDLTKSYVIRTPVDVDQDASGQIYTRKRGPARRTLNVGWSKGGVWTRGSYELADDEYSKFTDAAGVWPVTMIHEVPQIMDSLQAQVSGPHIPIVLLQDVHRLSGADTMLLMARHLAGGSIYGHMRRAMSFSIDAGQYGNDERLKFGFEVEEEV